MENTFHITRNSRAIYLIWLDDYSLEALNKIPTGFNNNLIWNIAHIVVVQQMLVYNLSGLPMMVSRDMVEKYKRGTRPDAPVAQEEVEKIRQLLTTTIDQTEADFAAGKFTQYQPYLTANGFHITSAAYAMEFNNYHEAMHLGMMMGLRKFL